MEIIINLTLEEMKFISAALNNDAICYKDYAEENIDDEEFFNDMMENYRVEKALSNRFEQLRESYSRAMYQNYVREWYEDHDEGDPACFAEWYHNDRLLDDDIPTREDILQWISNYDQLGEDFDRYFDTDIFKETEE